MANTVAITITLPEDIAQRMRAQGLKPSQELREALEARFAQEDIMAATLAGAKEVKLTLDDGTIGRFTGTEIAHGESSDVTVYVTENENVVAYEPDRRRYTVIEDPEEDLGEYLKRDPEAYVTAARALGFTPVIDLNI